MVKYVKAFGTKPEDLSLILITVSKNGSKKLVPISMLWFR